MKKGFTLIEVLFTVAIIGFIAVTVITTINPSALLQEGRDANRVSDLTTIDKAVSLYYSDAMSNPGTLFMGTSSVIYVSIPDPSATSTAGDQCQGLSLPSLPTGYTYQCAASSSYMKTNGAGWIPINFTSYLSGQAGSIISKIPVDPTNQSSSRLYYTYTTNGNDYEITAAMESAKYKIGGSGDVISNDGSDLATVYAKGTNLTLEPLDYGDSSLVGYWPLNEGSGTTAIDDSGNGNNARWYGNEIGTNGTYYTAGKFNTYAGIFSGPSTYIEGSSSVSLSVTSTVSLAAWVNVSSEPADYAIIVGKTYDGGSGWGGYYTEWRSANTDEFESAYDSPINSNSYMNAGNPIYADGNWHYVVATIDAPATTQSFYVDGALVASESNASGTSIVTTSAPLVMNPQYESNSNFTEEMSNVRIYNRILSPTEIMAMYKAGK